MALSNTDQKKKKIVLKIPTSKYRNENNKSKFQIFSYVEEETISSHKEGRRNSGISGEVDSGV